MDKGSISGSRRNWLQPVRIEGMAFLAFLPVQVEDAMSGRTAAFRLPSFPIGIHAAVAPRRGAGAMSRGGCEGKASSRLQDTPTITYNSYLRFPCRNGSVARKYCSG